MRDWDNIKEELKRNSHLFRIAKVSTISVQESYNKCIEILINDEKAVIHKSDFRFLMEYTDTYNLTFWVVENPFAIYIMEIEDGDIYLYSDEKC